MPAASAAFAKPASGIWITSGPEIRETLTYIDYIVIYGEY